MVKLFEMIDTLNWHFPVQHILNWKKNPTGVAEPGRLISSAIIFLYFTKVEKNVKRDENFSKLKNA